MERDRKSGVPSHYESRRSTVDAFSHDPREERIRYDSSPSFYNQDQVSRPSTEVLNGNRSAGYNRMSYFDPGRVEPLKGGYDEEDQLPGKNEAGWDVFADFNNTGPRYSAAFGNKEAGYQRISHPSTKLEDTTSSIGPIEMVTVPALGPEWRASEMHDMRKSAKREKTTEARLEKWKQWRRGERGMCGNYFTRKFTVFFLFGLCAAVGIVLAFTIPRVPSFAFNQNTPLAPATGNFNSSIPTEFSRAPANFSFPAYANLQVDTSTSFLPLTFTHLSGQIYDLDSNFQVGSGNLYSYTVPAKALTGLQLPLNFSYIATNDTDQTWANWYNACKNVALYANGTRPGLRFRIVLGMTILGLPTSSQTSAQLTSANCPIQLAINAA